VRHEVEFDRLLAADAAEDERWWGDLAQERAHVLHDLQQAVAAQVWEEVLDDVCDGVEQVVGRRLARADAAGRAGGV
jgi:hypothetical protein